MGDSRAAEELFTRTSYPVLSRRTVRRLGRQLVDRIRGQQNIDHLVTLGLEVGERAFIARNAYIDPGYPWLITIGEEATVGPRTIVLAHDASMQRHIHRTLLARVTIGDRAFIGAGAIVLAGSTVGDNAVIGAGSVVRGQRSSWIARDREPSASRLRCRVDARKAHRRGKRGTDMAASGLDPRGRDYEGADGRPSGLRWPQARLATSSFPSASALTGWKDERSQADLRRMSRARPVSDVQATRIASSEADHAAPLHRPRVAFVTDIVTPYMTVLFEALAHACELSVIFCSRMGTRGMEWRLELPFRHEVVEGLNDPAPDTGCDRFLPQPAYPRCATPRAPGGDYQWRLLVPLSPLGSLWSDPGHPAADPQRRDRGLGGAAGDAPRPSAPSAAPAGLASGGKQQAGSGAVCPDRIPRPPDLPCPARHPTGPPLGSRAAAPDRR